MRSPAANRHSPEYAKSIVPAMPANLAMAILAEFYQHSMFYREMLTSEQRPENTTDSALWVASSHLFSLEVTISRCGGPLQAGSTVSSPM